MEDSRQDAADPITAFLDANIVLEGRPLADLPWIEVQATGTIRVVIVPKAMEEIDAKKRDGRLGPHARAFNRLIGPAALTACPIVIREADPRVELSMAVCDRVPWDDYHELDPEDGDSRIVGEALHARGVDPLHRILISHDIKPLAYAAARGLAALHASDAWLRPMEPGPKDKEIQRLKQQVGEFRKNEPSFEVEIGLVEAVPLTVMQIKTLTPAETGKLDEAIRKRNPPTQRRTLDSFGSAFESVRRDHTYGDRYDRFLSEAVPRFVGAFRDKVELMFNQRLLSIRIENVGQIKADHLVVTVESSGGWMNDKLVFASPKGPQAPILKEDLFAHLPSLGYAVPARIGRHDFAFPHMPERGHLMEATCEDFRNGNAFEFDGVAGASTNGDPLVIRVSLTAGNLRGRVVKEARFEKTILLTAIGELVDLDQLVFLKSYPLKAEFDRLLKSEEFSRIEWDGRVDDE